MSLEALFVSGRIIDAILVLIAVEIAAIMAIRSRSGLRAMPLLANIGAGASLMIALRISLTSGDWHWIAVCLFIALVFHAIDVASRWGAPADPVQG